MRQPLNVARQGVEVRANSLADVVAEAPENDPSRERRPCLNSHCLGDHCMSVDGLQVKLSALLGEMAQAFML